MSETAENEVIEQPETEAQIEVETEAEGQAPDAEATPEASAEDELIVTIGEEAPPQE